MTSASAASHHVKDMLGHQSLEQTTAYLNVTLVGLKESMRRHDESAEVCKPSAKTADVASAPLCKAPAENEAQHQLN